MGLRIRKSVNLGSGLRVNFSKKGVGGSIGCKGARITKKAGGGVRKTVGIPGTGLSYVKDSGKKNRKNTGVKGNQSSGNRTHTPYFTFAFVVKIVSIFMIALCALLTLALPLVGIIGMTIGVLEFLWSKSLKKKGIKQALEEAETADLEQN